MNKTEIIKLKVTKDIKKEMRKSAVQEGLIHGGKGNLNAFMNMLFNNYKKRGFSNEY